MAQNTSHAVMAQRHEADDSLDDFPTQPWGTRALFEHVLPRESYIGKRAWEPCCNRGYMARPMAEYVGSVYSTDVFDYGWSGMHAQADFLFPGVDTPYPIDLVIANPPFRLAEQFIEKALAVSRVGCAMLVRSSFLEGVGRYRRLYSVRPPTITAIFVERLPLVKGRVDRKASTATSYSWLVWLNGIDRHPTGWVPPCRAQLERDSDYDVVIMGKSEE